MFRVVVSCDYCGNEIIGEYRRMRQEFTNKDEAGNYSDLCMDCLKMVTDYKRIPVLTEKDLLNADI